MNANEAKEVVTDFLRERTRFFRGQYPHWVEQELGLLVLTIPKAGDYLKVRTKQMKEINDVAT